MVRALTQRRIDFRPRRELADRVARFSSDDHLTAMLNSIGRALTDKANCLIHLYEILESLKDRFGSNRNAMKTLSLSDSQWSDLGRFANYEPLQEGRHRGSKVLALRPITEVEFDHCAKLRQNSLWSTCIT